MLLILDSTSRTLKAKMSMPAMTTNCSVVVAYADNSGTTFTEGAVPTVLNGTTSVTILPAPAAGVRRVVKSVCVYNPDTDTHTTTLIFNDNTTEYPITRLTLASGASWSSDDQTGVNVGGAVTDGDKGDISVSSGGTTWTIDDGVVSYGKIQSVTNNRLLGRSDTAGGQVQEITVGTGLSLSAGTLTATSGSMVYPGAGVAVSTGSAWGTSKASPSGDIVGTTDSQVLTNKTISGASNTLSNVNLASQVTGTLPVANGGTGATTSTGSGSVVLATSPTLTTPLLGVATGTSFNGITGLSSTTPIVDGTAAIGTGTTAARADHVHPTDTSRAATSGTLAQFAATTSAQLAGVISDETGSGALVFANSPTMTTPNIGAATGTSFNSITGLSSTTPSADSGSGVVGISTTVARADHQHPVSGVTSFSAGSTGLTPSSGTTGAVTLAGMLAVTNGGTGATTAGGALTSLGAYPASNPNGYTSNTGTVTGVTGTSPVASSGGTAPAISLASGYGDTQNPYGSKTANSFLAAPNGTAAAPTFRAIVAADIPTLNQNTTGTASNVTGTVAIANGGTGQTTRQAAMDALAGAVTAGQYLRGDGTDVVMAALQATDLTGAVAVANGGTGLTSTPTNGQLDIGNGSGFTRATLTAGSNITITNGPGSITIASTASGGGGGGAAFKNSVINGDFAVGQRGTSFTSVTPFVNNDDAYTLDRWYILSDGNDTIDVTQAADAPTNQLYSIGLDVETVNKKFGIAQIIEQVNCVGLIGQNVSLSFKARVTSTNKLDNVKAAIVSWSGTADAVTSDIISAWGAEGTNPTLIANATYENTPANLSVTTSWATYKIENVAIDTASAKNIIVFVWSDVTDTTLGDFLYITDVQLEASATATDFERLPIDVSTARCQRYCQLLERETNIGMGFQVLSDKQFFIRWYATTPMRAVPAFTSNITGIVLSAGAASGTSIAFVNYATNALVNVTGSTALTFSTLNSARGGFIRFNAAGTVNSGANGNVVSLRTTTSVVMVWDAEL